MELRRLPGPAEAEGAVLSEDIVGRCLGGNRGGVCRYLGGRWRLKEQKEVESGGI